MIKFLNYIIEFKKKPKHKIVKIELNSLLTGHEARTALAIYAEFKRVLEMQGSHYVRREVARHQVAQELFLLHEAYKTYCKK